MKFHYEDCIKYIKGHLGIELFDYQEVMLKAFCEGLEVRTARCVGRTKVANAFGKYVVHLIGENDYSKEPDIVFSYTCAVANGLLSSKSIERFKQDMTKEAFEREFCCTEQSQ